MDGPTDGDVKNILYLCSAVPYPPNRGDKLRAYHQIKHLSMRHAIWCVAYGETPGDRLYAALLQRWCRGVVVLPADSIRSVLRGLGRLITGGAIEERTADPRIARIVDQWAASISFDVVIASGSRVAASGLRAPGRVRIMDYWDLDSRKWKWFVPGPAARLVPESGGEVGAPQLTACERGWLGDYDRVVVVSDAEARGLGPASLDGIKVRAVGNGVVLPSQKDLDPIGSQIVGFVGSMDYPPNVDGVTWFADAVWPGVLAAHPSARFQIAGRSPLETVRSLARRPGIDVLGEVPHASETMRQWQICVAPIRLGCSLQNKVLEAMAASRPVIATPAAVEALTARDREQLVIADSEQGMVYQVCRLLADPQECLRIGRAARHAVAREHSWPREIAKLESLFSPLAPHLSRE